MHQVGVACTPVTTAEFEAGLEAAYGPTGAASTRRLASVGPEVPGPAGEFEAGLELMG